MRVYPTGSGLRKVCAGRSQRDMIWSANALRVQLSGAVIYWAANDTKP